MGGIQKNTESDKKASNLVFLKDVIGEEDDPKEDASLQALYDEIDATFPAFKLILDKYPNKAFQLDFHPITGYFVDYDVNVLVHHLRTQD